MSLESIRRRWDLGGMALALAAGVVLGITFTPAGGPLLPFFAIAPLGYALARRPGPGGGLLPGFLTASVGHGIGLQWMVPALSWRTPLAVPVFLLVLCLIGMVAALAVESALRLHRRWGIPIALALASTWVGFEWVAARVPGVPYAWLNVGESLVWWPWGAHWVALGGAALLTLWTVAVGAAMGTAAHSRSRRGTFLAAALAVMPALAGWLSAASPGADGEARILLAVQPGRDTPREQLMDWAGDLQRIAGPSPPDLIVFPERFLPVSPTALTGDRALAEALGAPVLYGAVDSLRGDTGVASGVANAAFLVRPSRSDRQVAHKQRLVPGLEDGGALGGWDRVLPTAGYRAGAVGSVLELDGWSVGVLICYDVAFGTLSRNLVRDGADLLVVVSNDDWLDPAAPFRVTVAYWQHETQGRLRAAENGVPLVQVATTGRTFSLDSRGRRYPDPARSGPPPVEPGVASLRAALGTGESDPPMLPGLLGWMGALCLCLGAWPPRSRHG